MGKAIIIGAGPAGCTAALYAARANLAPLLFEGALSKEILPGGQLMTTTEVENFPGYPDGTTGPEMMQDFKRQAERFGTRTLSKTVTAVDFSQRPFRVTADGETWETKAVIIATGARAKYLGIESEQRFLNRGVSACATCDGALPRFRDKPVAVVGGGDTAMEEALFLTNFASRVHVVHRRDALRASKIMGARVLAHEKIALEWNSVVDEVLGDDNDGVTSVRLQDTSSGELRELRCSGVFMAIGHKPNTDLFIDVLEMDEVGYIRTKPGTARTSVDGVFAAGDVQDKVYRQAVTAAGSGCMAAIDCTRWLEAQAQ
ncbi:MAG TPA: thioredoxin-disulfide reductase [Candidatus Hydrogenedentes bacterium]|nr:thioredoxin-disulfide reductase [Candidatus Hydrogenedentota bacterium]HIJ73348.1 thioredoxin-disulfide reductase [Candidatus Hydrogenedentota bacterium]